AMRGDSSNGIQEGLKSALQGLKRETLASTLRGMIRLAEAREKEAKSSGPLVDAVLLVQPRELDRATVVGLMGIALKSASDMPELLDETKSALARLAVAHAND